MKKGPFGLINGTFKFVSSHNENTVLDFRNWNSMRAHRIPISKIQHGGRPPFLKSLYFHNWSELHEIWYAYTNFNPGDGSVTKFWNSQIQNGGWTPHWKSLFGYNTSAYSPIKM